MLLIPRFTLDKHLCWPREMPAFVWKRAYTQMHTQTHIHSPSIQTCALSHTHTHTHAHTSREQAETHTTCAYAHTHTCTHTHMRTDTHTHTHTHRHKYIQSCQGKKNIYGNMAFAHLCMYPDFVYACTSVIWNLHVDLEKCGDN